MSTKSIWNALRNGGMTDAGAAAMIGNMLAESSLRSKNVQDGMGYTDSDYTCAVDNGRISRESFANDQRGYGLCQWTYNARKRMLYDFAVKYGASSIGDEAMQVAFLLYEFPSEAPDTWKLCCTSNDLYKCTEWICKYYERPYYNNIDDRYLYAQKFYDEFNGTEITDSCESCTINPPVQPPHEESTDSVDVTVRCLRNGDKGRDVFIAQCGLNDMGYSCGVADGDFGQNTLAAVNDFKRAYGLNQNGVIDQDVWQIMFQ